MALPQGFGHTELPKVISVALADRLTDQLWVPLQVDPTTGGLFSTLIQPFTTGSVTLKVPTADDIDADVPSNLDKHIGLDTRAFLYGFESVGDDWDRIRALPDNADARAAFTNGVLLSQAELLGFNGTTFDRLRSEGTDADAQAVTTLGALNARGFLFGFNGTTFDRLRSGGNDADNQTTVSLGLLGTRNFLYGFSTPGWQRIRGLKTNADSIGQLSIEGSLSVMSHSLVFDSGAVDVWNRMRGTTTLVTQFASAARTASIWSSSEVCFNNPAYIAVLEVTVLGSATLDFVIYGSVGGGALSAELFRVTISSVGSYIISVGRGVRETAGPGASIYAGGAAIPVPQKVFIGVEPPDATSNTYEAKTGFCS